MSVYSSETKLFQLDRSLIALLPFTRGIGHLAPLMPRVWLNAILAMITTLRLERQWKMIEVMLHSEGLTVRPGREQLEQYAMGRALMIIQSGKWEKDMVTDNRNYHP